jgi:hypothetical protein
MGSKLTRLTHKITIQLHLVAESFTICSSRSRRPVRKLLDTPSYVLIMRVEVLLKQLHFFPVFLSIICLLLSHNWEACYIE